MLNFLLVVDVLIAIGLVALILLQRGPGATAGAAFGSGASGTVFGARGSSNFLTRATAVMAAGFFVVSMAMAMIAARQVENIEVGDLGVMSQVEQMADEVAEDAQPTLESAIDEADAAFNQAAAVADDAVDDVIEAVSDTASDLGMDDADDVPALEPSANEAGADADQAAAADDDSRDGGSQ
ncbi:MAG: hypothetical protein Tsb002_06760 [Wenzhouxiangellaceae bacterium]